ncbi:separin [Dunckerocampus dactyliophorus]|uniref:separin n=1 Tax=Dunckerocampus dactyliophorus TaxID=161453 RepID=UPI00240523AB|nr:separin [Dunckerocampus dactyliophorus]
MECSKFDEYVKRTASAKETQLLFRELETRVKNPLWLQGRTLCDRVIRACNHQLGLGSLDLEHISQLVKLVELALRGYDMPAWTQNSPLYMEKILFHIVKKLSSLQVHSLCSHVAALLHARLSPMQRVDTYDVVVRSCFSVLWNGLAGTAVDQKSLSRKDKLHWQFQALSFLLLLDKESDTASISKAAVYTEHAVSEFAKTCEAPSEDMVSFLLQEMHALLSQCWALDGSQHTMTTASVYTLFEMVLITIKTLCKGGQYSPASVFLNDIRVKMRNAADGHAAALELGKWAIKMCSMKTSEERLDQALRECARTLRSLPCNVGGREAHCVLEGCALVTWAVESCHKKGFSGTVLLACFSFLQEHQDLMIRILQKSSAIQSERSRLQEELCFNIHQGFVLAYKSLVESQLEDGNTLARVLLYCQATAGRMTTELSNENHAIKAAIAVSNLASGLYNQRLYDQAFTLVEILCHHISKNSLASLSVDRLSRPFMLAVQTSRKAGHLERALDWVILWLKALGDKITLHMTEPISLWVKAKMDAARNSQEDIRLRTIRDGFGPGALDEGVLLFLLDEELRCYKEEAGDTSHERYNTLCDLLDICHEESPHTHLRAVYLCEMAQVVCFQDFSEQTNCTAVDFTHEALRLLEEEAETPENAESLKDAKAHALLWLYICTLEKNLQEAIDRDRKLQEMRQQSPCVQNPIGTNDLDYEDKQKNEDSILVYDNLHFSLAAHNKLCQPLEKALNEWAALLHAGLLPSVRNPKQTCSSIVIAASLLRLMGKPLKALEAYQLAVKLSRQLADTQGGVSSLCQSASLLLEMGATELALAQIEQAEKIASDTISEGPSSLSLLLILLRAQYCYSTGQVSRGVAYLCAVLKEANEQRHCRSWYLLRAQALQLCSSYLSLDTSSLPQSQRSCITQHGFQSPDAALYESLKLLSGLLLTLVGKFLYGPNGNGSDVRFIDNGSNLVFKWRLLWELLNCAKKMVVLRASCGAVNDARLQCQEALKLATKLQALSQCAELLVVKAELELMQGEREESGFDLDKVRNLLEGCTDFPATECKPEVKIKPRKGRPVQKVPSPSPVVKDDLKDILSTRWTLKEPVVWDQGSSPRLKAVPFPWLSCITHKPGCQCSCCSEPLLGRVAALWAAVQADTVLQLDPSEAKVGFKLYWATLARCKTITANLEAKLAELFSVSGPTKSSLKPYLIHDVVGRVYLHLAFSGLEPRHTKFCSVWKVLEAGLAFVDFVSSPELRTVRAGLMAAKAELSLVAMSAKKGCRREELFSKVWTWRAPKYLKELKCENQTTLKETKSVKKPRNVKVGEPRSQLTRPTAKGKGLLPVTPVTKFSASELSAFDFNVVAPSLTFTPVPKAKALTSAQKAQRTACKLQFQVFDESLPARDKAHVAPPAPRRAKKSRFKVAFSDESDTENNAKQEAAERRSKKRAAIRQATLKTKAASAAPAEKSRPSRQTRSKSTALPRDTSSEDESLLRKPSSTRRGRARNVSSKEVESEEGPEKMRAIEEESNEVLDFRLEDLRTSDTEAEECPAADVDLEVLRRDLCCDFDRYDWHDQRSGCKAKGPQTHLPHPDTRPDNLSLEDIQALLRSAWLSVQHFPPPSIFPSLCSFLALSTGQQDPVTTAMLHSQSLGITSRHRTIRHLSSCVQKLKKVSNELADEMDSLTLDGSSLATNTAQRLSQLENIFSFPTADSSAFPQSHCQHFVQQLQHLPSDVTVCVMSVIGGRPQEMGESILLSRLQKGSTPVTVHIPTSTEPHSIRCSVQEMDSILVEQKALNGVSDKALWWEGRRALDSRVEQLLKAMELLLGCWKSLLLPRTSDAKLATQAKHLCNILRAKGVTASEEMLETVLCATPVLSQKDWKSFALGVCPQWDDECEQLLHSAVLQLAGREEPCGHVVLILDKYLQRLPWESISILRSRSVSRMPSLQSLIALSIQKESEHQPILKHGVDTTSTFYLLDPDGNLGHTQEHFRELFSSKRDWDGVCGRAPRSGQLEEAVATKDLYIFMGHGAGVRFLDSRAVLKRPMRAASLLIGCSSAALAVRGDQEGQGIILNYLIAGCPFVLGNLWDVTDRDIDRFAKALLESWLSSESGSALLDYMGPSRQATHLKHLIGAAPVVYGLPIHLQ